MSPNVSWICLYTYIYISVAILAQAISAQTSLAQAGLVQITSGCGWACGRRPWERNPRWPAARRAASNRN